MRLGYEYNKDDLYDKKFKNKKGLYFIVKDYYKDEYFSKRYTCVFDSGYIAYGINRGSIKSGAITDYYSPTIDNIGVVGDKSLCRTDEYWIWVSMIRRVYNQTSLEKRPSYLYSSISEDWLDLRKFSKDFKELCGYKEYIEFNKYTKFNLDKDILSVDNKIYGKETCCIVPSAINQLITYNKSDNTSGFIGVSWCNRDNKYTSGMNVRGKRVSFGRFNSLIDAIDIYWKNKIRYSKEILYCDYWWVNDTIKQNTLLKIKNDYNSEREKAGKKI